MGRLYVSFDEPLVVICPRCGGGRGNFVNPCDWCGATGGVPPEGVDDRLATLAHNLAIGAGLCRAFNLGGCLDEVSGADWITIMRWTPGCGKPAP